MTKRQKPTQWLIVAALCLFLSVVGFYIGQELEWWLVDKEASFIGEPRLWGLIIVSAVCGILIALTIAVFAITAIQKHRMLHSSSRTETPPEGFSPDQG